MPILCHYANGLFLHHQIRPDYFIKTFKAAASKRTHFLKLTEPLQEESTYTPLSGGSWANVSVWAVCLLPPGLLL